MNFHGNSLKYIFLVLIFLSVFTPHVGLAQNNQLWLDYMGYPLGGDINWDWEINTGYNRLLGKGGWSDFYLNNTFTYQKIWWLLFDGSFEFHYTRDPEYFNSIELRPWVMTTARWLTEGEYLNLYYPYFAVLIENRNIYYEDEEPNQHTFRLRLRAGGKITLNTEKMTVGTVFINFRGEYFTDIGKGVTERFASKHRVMLGLGYIFTYAFRAEFYYYIHQSRNTYEDEFNTTDNIFSFLVRHYF